MSQALEWLAYPFQARSAESARNRCEKQIAAAQTPAEVRETVLQYLRAVARPATLEIVDHSTRPSAKDHHEIRLRFLGKTVGIVRMKHASPWGVRARAIQRVERAAPFAAAMLCSAKAPADIVAGVDRRRTTPPFEAPRPLTTDTATGLPDESYLDAVLPQAFGRSGVSVYSLLLIEPVNIRRVRVSQGSVYADSALAVVARAIVQTLRLNDPVVRFDDDRLVAVLPGASRNDAQRVAHALSRAIAEAGQTASTPRPLTARIGVACAPYDGTSMRALQDAALRDLVQTETPRSWFE